jgi:hypothetical protein
MSGSLLALIEGVGFMLDCLLAVLEPPADVRQPGRRHRRRRKERVEIGKVKSGKKERSK